MDAEPRPFATWVNDWIRQIPALMPIASAPVRESDGKRGAVIMDLGPISMLAGAVLSAARFDVRYLRVSPAATPLVSRAASWGIRPVDLEGEPVLGSGAITFKDPGENAVRLVESLEPERLCSRLSLLSADPAVMERALRVDVVSRCAADLDGVGAVAMWMRVRQFRSVTLFSTSKWDRRVLGQPGVVPAGRIFHRADRLAQAASRGAGRVRSRLTARSRAQPLRGDPPNVTSPICGVPGLIERDERVKILFLPHMGLGHGQLYRWDHLFSEDERSALFPANMVALSYDSETLAAQMPSAAIQWDRPAQRGRRLARVFAHGLPAVRSVSDVGLLWDLSRTCESALGLAANLKDRFPNAKVAVLAYDMLVPRPVSIALLAAGLRSVATQERPAASFQPTVPKIVDTYLTAGPIFSDAILSSPVACVNECRSVGMWRTDLLHDYRHERPPDVVADAQASGLKVVVVLPYPVEVTPEASAASIQLSWSTGKALVADVLALANAQPDTFFILRGKNADWWTHPAFAEQARALRQQANVWVDTEYSEINRSYRLCAHADLIIARHTSLAEECLALDIPTILHDYAHNISTMFAPLFPYLPRELWAHSREELLAKTHLALEHDGAQFRSWWVPKRTEYFGSYCDGFVRARSRSIIEEMASTSSRPVTRPERGRSATG